MGVHFTVTVDHNLGDTSLDAVCGHFAPLEPVFLEISARWPTGQNTWLDITEPGNAQPNHFYAPAGFSVQIGSAALNFHPCIRFETFIDAVLARELLRGFSRQLAHTLGQERALYAPCQGTGDMICDLITDGCSLAAIEAYLRKRSAPSVTIDELASRSWPELRYYIDQFDSPEKRQLL